MSCLHRGQFSGPTASYKILTWYNRGVLGLRTVDSLAGAVMRGKDQKNEHGSPTQLHHGVVVMW
eukprot:3060379-Rhodomonas_salina.1